MARAALVFILAAVTALFALPPAQATAACYGWNGHIYWCLPTLTATVAPTPMATATVDPTASPLAPTPTATAVPTSVPTSTPVRPTPSPTPVVTPTATPVPIIVSERGKYLQDVAITRNGSTLTLPAYSSLPLSAKASGVTRAVVVIHGTNRNAVDYFDYASAAVPRDVLVVAPRFMTSSDSPRSTELMWTSSGWKEGNESTGSRPWRISSFETADEVVRALRSTFPDLGVVVVAGHSAGGQFVQRYAATNVDARMHFVVSNPSSYMYFDRERPVGGGFAVPSGCSSYNHYKYGLEDMASDAPHMAAIGASTLTARYRDANVTYLLGEDDTNPNATSLDVTCEAKAQGANRLERGQQFYRHLASVYGDAIYARHRLDVVPNVGHDARSMFGSTLGRVALIR